MSVILKQRTCVTEDGKAVPDGHPDARFLVGPKGAKISDDKAEALGLVDGAFAKKLVKKLDPETKEVKTAPETKEVTAKSTK